MLLVCPCFYKCQTSFLVHHITQSPGSMKYQILDCWGFCLPFHAFSWHHHLLLSRVLITPVLGTSIKYKVSMNYKFRGKLEEMTVVYECTCRQQTVMVIVTGHASIEYIKTNRFWIQPKLDKPVVKWIWSTSVIQPDAPFQWTCWPFVRDSLHKDKLYLGFNIMVTVVTRLCLG